MHSIDKAITGQPAHIQPFICAAQAPFSCYVLQRFFCKQYAWRITSLGELSISELTSRESSPKQWCLWSLQ